MILTAVIFVTCSTLQVDVISLDMCQALPFRPKANPIGVAIERGIMFEISYGRALGDSSALQLLLQNTALLVRMCGGRNIIFTSNALEALQLRGPQDIANLGVTMGISQENARKSVNGNIAGVMKRALTRRSIKGIMTAEIVPDDDDKEDDDKDE